ncbi:MAG: PH domain-containing protein [Planctomycetota bacterium]
MAEASASRYRVLREASFDEKLPSYYLLSGVIVLVVTIVGAPLAVVYFVVGRLLIQKYIDRLACTLTERTLEIKKGWLNRVESTVPLEKITDLQMIQGPLMRLFGLHGFKVETAGQSAGPGASLVSLIGIVDAPAFREAVLEQRDELAEGRVLARGRSDASEDAAGPTATALLAEIRDSLRRIEGRLPPAG